jgi:uncharacterized protein (TIGR03067 family)
MAWKVPLILTLLFISAGVSGAGGASKEEDTLQGAWSVVSHMNNDRKSSVEDVKKMKVVIKGRTLTLSGGGDSKMEIGFKLDPSKSPKAIDLELKQGKKQTVHGIYELKGDLLKFAWNNSGEAPKTFPKEPKEGTGMIVLKRATGK